VLGEERRDPDQLAAVLDDDDAELDGIGRGVTQPGQQPPRRRHRPVGLDRQRVPAVDVRAQDLDAIYQSSRRQPARV
jgi:hypothetical protein